MTVSSRTKTKTPGLVPFRDVDAILMPTLAAKKRREKKVVTCVETVTDKSKRKEKCFVLRNNKSHASTVKAVCVFFKGIAQAGRGSFDSTLDLRASPTPFCPPLRCHMLVLVVLRLQGRFRRSRENFVLPRAFHGLDINI